MKEIFYDWGGYNVKIFEFLNQMCNIGIWPETLRCLSFFFNIENFAVYYLALCLFCYYRFRGCDAEAFKSVYNRLVFVGICYATFGLTYAALKFSINMPRPFCSMLYYQTIIDVTKERCMSSFPSSHAGLSLVMTILAWDHLSKAGKKLAEFVVVLVAFSRIALAMHYPADIVYGYLIALIVMAVSYCIFKVLENNIIRYIGGRLYHFLK